MRRIKPKPKTVWKVWHLFKWLECVKCGQEVRREHMWEFTFRAGPYFARKNICQSCAPTAWDAGVIRSNYLNMPSPRLPPPPMPECKPSVAVFPSNPNAERVSRERMFNDAVRARPQPKPVGIEDTMPIYTNNTFEGYWPVGSAAVVCAADEEEAAAMLNVHLATYGPEQSKPVEAKDMKRFDQGVRVLWDGNY